MRILLRDRSSDHRRARSLEAEPAPRGKESEPNAPAALGDAVVRPEWLADEGPALDLEHLQLLLDRFRAHDNGERPHQGIGNQTPAERYLPARPPRAPLGELELADDEKSPPNAPHTVTRKVWPTGVVAYDGLAITLGRRWAGATVRIVEVGALVHVYLGEELIRVLAPDRSRRYQNLGKRPRRRT
jgi:Integrase core domain